MLGEAVAPRFSAAACCPERVSLESSNARFERRHERLGYQHFLVAGAHVGQLRKLTNGCRVDNFVGRCVLVRSEVICRICNHLAESGLVEYRSRHDVGAESGEDGQVEQAGCGHYR